MVTNATVQSALETKVNVLVVASPNFVTDTTQATPDQSLLHLKLPDEKGGFKDEGLFIGTFYNKDKPNTLGILVENSPYAIMRRPNSMTHGEYLEAYNEVWIALRRLTGDHIYSEPIQR